MLFYFVVHHLVRSFNKVLPSVKFAEGKVLVVVILC